VARTFSAVCLALAAAAAGVGAQALPDTQAIAADWSTGADPTLWISPEDIVVDQSIAGGYDLWVRRKPGIGSILLTESSADPAKRLDSYAFRDPVVRDTNLDEWRILDGKRLEETRGSRSIVDSTAEPHGSLGSAYHVFIPTVVVYGYPWSRSGEIEIVDGTFINIRAFRKGQADYTGPYLDNPFRLNVTQKVSYVPRPAPAPPVQVAPVPEAPVPAAAPTLESPERPPTEPQAVPLLPVAYMPDAVEALTRIARQGGGTAALSTGEDDLGSKIGQLLDETADGSLDLVLALDTTNSMRDDMLYLRRSIVTVLRNHTARFARFRVGLMYYRDYNDEYLVRPLPFAADMDEVQRQIDSVQVGGGRDMPEAVYEALYHSIHRYDWTAEERLLLLIGDAPPHPIARGKITKEIVERDAAQAGIRISTIILPP
jgi:hypothetical protein